MEENLVEEAVTEYFGERCPEYEPGCACCEGWKQYDVMRAYALGVLWTKEELSKLELAHVNLIKNHAYSRHNGAVGLFLTKDRRTEMKARDLEAEDKAWEAWQARKQKAYAAIETAYAEWEAWHAQIAQKTAAIEAAFAKWEAEDRGACIDGYLFAKIKGTDMAGTTIPEELK